MSKISRKVCVNKIIEFYRTAVSHVDWKARFYGIIFLFLCILIYIIFDFDKFILLNRYNHDIDDKKHLMEQKACGLSR